ncbi:MAG: sigma-54 interaction domain-containing protein [Planctomycetaceae bacterium]
MSYVEFATIDAEGPLNIMEVPAPNTDVPAKYHGYERVDRHNRILLDVWREACRHIEIVESLDRIAPLILRELPARVILIRSISMERLCVETVASTFAAHNQTLRAESRTECSASDLDGLLEWVQRRTVRQDSVRSLRADLPSLLPNGIAGECLAGPLVSEHGHLGALIVGAQEREQFQPHHLRLFQALLEPFTVALENDRRLHELVLLREKAEAENRALMTKLGRTEGTEQVVGEESGLQAVMERVKRVARADVPVLILGETGSGKEVIARAIHRQSFRESGPFVRVNCGAIPPELIDSELFGHEKGSFTGAAGLRRGWFERADGGTLFLDECGELPPAVQVRLLRVLQDGTFERVGGERLLHVDVRVIAATHRDLKAMVSEKSFREDLWYRLAVFPIHLPPLRERREDIPAMARHFALRAAHKLGLRPCIPTDEQIALLINYSWLGNVRELASVMDRAAILGGGETLDVASALGTVPISAPAADAGVHVAARRAETIVTRFPSMDEAAAAHIEAALQHAKGRIEGPHGAARLLGVNPHTLRSRMRKLGIDWQRFRGDGAAH